MYSTHLFKNTAALRKELQNAYSEGLDKAPEASNFVLLLESMCIHVRFWVKKISPTMQKMNIYGEAVICTKKGFELNVTGIVVVSST